MKPLRILFVHEVNWLEKPVYEIHDYPELLARRGHEVVFVDFAEGVRPSGWRRIVDLRTRVRFGQSRVHGGPGIELRTPGRVVAPPLDRLLASITQVPEVWQRLRDGGFDAVVLYGVPTNGWQTARVARHFDVPVLFRSIDLSHRLRATPFGVLIRWAEKAVINNSDWVSTNNIALAEYCRRRGAAGVSTDYPGVDLRRFSPGSRNQALADRYGIAPGDRVVLFMGTFFRFSGLDWFLEAYAETLRSRQDTRLVLVGGGEAAAGLRRRAARLGLTSRVTFTGFVDYDQLAEHLRLADVAINPFRAMAATNHALPAKVLQYVASGVPTVSTPLAGLQGLLHEGQGVRYASEGLPFVDAVNGLLTGDDWGGMARAGRRRLEEVCQWDVAIAMFEQAVATAIDRHRSR